MSTYAKKIGIIGGGPGGLALARILLQNGVKATVYEREEGFDRRPQGSTLDLHEQTGQAAMEAAGLMDDFNKYARPEGQDFILSDRTGKHAIESIDRPRGKPEIDRAKLRQILIESLPEGIIRWGSNVRSVEVGTIHFADHTESGFDLIVGADGAWSKVRPLLTHIPPFYAGIGGLDLKHTDVRTRHPKVSELVGEGSHFVFGEEDRRVLLCQRNGEGSIRTYAVAHKPENWMKESGIDFSDLEAAKEACLKEYAHWAPEYQELIRTADEVVPRAMYMLPVGIRWPTQSGVTLIGDAAHLMTPFAGEGVNAALADALQLAQAIVKHSNDVTAAIQDYEVKMFPRTAEKAQRTWGSTLSRFAPGAIDEFKKRALLRGGQQSKEAEKEMAGRAKQEMK